MREFVRPAVAALSVACLAGAMAVVSNGGALAQGKQVDDQTVLLVRRG